MDPLDQLMSTTDKFESGYVSRYIDIAASLPRRANVLELGLDKGGSLDLWRILFPEIQTLACVEHDEKKIDDYRERSAPWRNTRTLRCDQTDISIPKSLGRTQFDLIIDDASHDPAKTLCSFGILWPFVFPHGVYVIEDWRVHPVENKMSMIQCINEIIDESCIPGSDIESVSVLPIGMVIIRKVEF